MKVSYYPGCSLHSTGIEYNISTQKICKTLGIDLIEIENWICCGSSPTHQSDEILSIALPIKNIANSKKNNNINEICVPCASCYSRLKFAQEKIKDIEIQNKVEYIIDSKDYHNVTVSHLLDVIIKKIGLDKIKTKVKKLLSKFKVASYYGCLLTRPPKITEKVKYENPDDMESILGVLGVENIDWNMKTYCCGASFALIQPDVMLELTKRILEDAVSAGANAISVACPLCHFNLDSRQKKINKKYNTNFNIPIFYFSQLMGLSFGISPNRLGVFRHITKVKEYLFNKELL